MAIFNAGVPRILPNEIYHIKGKVLDIGCGAGYLTGGILKKTLPKLNVYGLDISKTAVSYASKKYLDVKFIVGNVYKLPFPSNYFDAVVANCILEHLEKPQKALQEIRRVMTKQALFCSITPIEADKFVFFQSGVLTKKYHGHLQRFDRDKLIRLINKNGFKIKRYYFSGFIFCQLISGIYLRLFKLLNKPSEFQITDSKLNPIKYLINFLINVESAIIPNKIPGLYMHIICSKNR